MLYYFRHNFPPDVIDRTSVLHSILVLEFRLDLGTFPISRAIANHQAARHNEVQNTPIFWKSPTNLRASTVAVGDSTGARR